MGLGKSGGFDEALKVDAQIEQEGEIAVGLSHKDSSNGNDTEVGSTFCGSSASTVKSKDSFFEKMIKNLDPTVLVGMMSILAGVGILIISEWLFDAETDSEY